MSKNKEKRKQIMLNLLKEEEVIHLSDLSKVLAVSEMTTRRYVAESKSLVQLAGSYIFLKKKLDGDQFNTYEMDIETDRNIERKRVIGHAVASLIEENDVVFIDCGTTTPFIAKSIDNTIHFKAICCSLNIFNILESSERCQIMLTGGNYYEQTQVFSCPSAIEMIRDIRITKAFISAAGIDRKLGLTCFNQYETDIKKEVMKSSQKVYLVADSSKFGEVKISYFGDLNQIGTIITDSGIQESDRKWIDELGLNLILGE